MGEDRIVDVSDIVVKHAEVPSTRRQWHRVGVGREKDLLICRAAVEAAVVVGAQSREHRAFAGDEVRVDIMRDGKPHAVTVRLGELPEN